MSNIDSLLTRNAGFAAFAIGTAASGGFGPFLAGQCIELAGVRAAFGAPR